MRVGLLGSAGTLVAGVALIVGSVAAGEAHVSLLVFVPVVSGSSVLFLVGVLLLILGFFSLPFSLTGVDSEPPPSAPGTTAPPSAGAGGFVLIGPVPIVFGSWKGISRRARWALALLGSALLIVALVGFAFFVR